MTTVITNHFELGDSTILWKEEVLPDRLHDQLLQSFQDMNWYGGDYEGRKVSRKQRWYHREGEYFCTKWPNFDRWQSHSYTDTLYETQLYIQAFVKKEFDIEIDINSVLVNYYEHGTIIIPKHRDNEEIFGDNPTVIVVSLGSTRTLRFSRVEPDASSLKGNGQTIDIDLKPKSILIMLGTTQKYFCHELLPSDSKKPRYSMTFRKHAFTTKITPAQGAH